MPTSRSRKPKRVGNRERFRQLYVAHLVAILVLFIITSAVVPYIGFILAEGSDYWKTLIDGGWALVLAMSLSAACFTMVWDTYVHSCVTDYAKSGSGRWPPREVWLQFALTFGTYVGCCLAYGGLFEKENLGVVASLVACVAAFIQVTWTILIVEDSVTKRFWKG